MNGQQYNYHFVNIMTFVRICYTYKYKYVVYKEIFGVVVTIATAHMLTQCCTLRGSLHLLGKHFVNKCKRKNVCRARTIDETIETKLLNIIKPLLVIYNIPYLRSIMK